MFIAQLQFFMNFLNVLKFKQLLLQIKFNLHTLFVLFSITIHSIPTFFFLNVKGKYLTKAMRSRSAEARMKARLIRPAERPRRPWHGRHHEIIPRAMGHARPVYVTIRN